jgi:competence protein ComEC
MHSGSRTTQTKTDLGTPDLRKLILLFTAGVLFAHTLPALPALHLLMAASLPALWPWRGRSHWGAAVLGLLLAVAQGQARLAEHWPVDRHGQDLALRGVIASLPERGEQSQRFLFEPEVPALQGVPRRIRVSWYRAEQAVAGGECWQFTLRMRTPRGSMNPGGFDYEGWLFAQGIGATATVRAAEPCGVSPGYPVLRARQWLVERLHAWLPEHPARALVAALTVGDRSEFSDADWETFRVTGTSHLVAISGLHVGIIAGAAFFLLRWLWSAWPALCLLLPAQRAALLGTLGFAGGYALMAGFLPPVQRALIMLVVVALAAWLHRLTSPSRVLALAWLAVLLIEPSAVLSAGLWLSFGAVAAILYVSAGRVRAPPLWHSIIYLQLMLAVALVPLTLYFFQGAAWLAPAANLVAVPLFMLLTPLVLASVLLAAAVPSAGIPTLEWTASLLQGFRRGLETLASAPEPWLPASPEPAVLLLALCGIVLLFAPRGLPLRALGALCLIPLFIPGTDAGRRPLEVAVLDVGQGLAVAVHTARHTLLYDAGPAWKDGFDAGDSVVVPYLLHRGVRRVDRLVLSHDHNDHAGGIPAVRTRLRVAGEIGTAAGRECRDGESWEWDGVRFEILHPDAGHWPINNRSCVVRVSGPDFSVLLPGDVERSAERRLVRVHAERLRADVLVAPHHGSASSSTPDFVEAVQPRLVIHGAGWRNHFRHPRPEVVGRYAGIGARQYVTGNSGALIVTMQDDGSFAVTEWRRRARRFWNAEVEP